MDQLTYKLRLNQRGLQNVTAKEAALKEIADYVKEEILSRVGSGYSPVDGYGNFPAYSKEYKKFKQEYSSASTVNLELTGAMLDALKYEINVRDGVIELGIWGDEADKADGHNNFSGKSDLPLRRFIPKDNQKFVAEIENGIDNIISDYEDASGAISSEINNFISGFINSSNEG